MAFDWGALASAGLSALGDIAGAGITQAGAEKLQKRGFQHQYAFRSSAYPDTMASMRAGGLNPMLASGASPPVASASGGAGPSMAGIGSRAIDAYRRGKKINPETALLKEQLRLMGEQVWLTNAQAGQANTQAAKNKAEAQLTTTENALRLTDLPAASAKEQMDRTKAGEVLRWIHRGKQAINPFSGSSRRRR